jgi:hypothetical protein
MNVKRRRVSYANRDLPYEDGSEQPIMTMSTIASAVHAPNDPRATTPEIPRKSGTKVIDDMGVDFRPEPVAGRKSG